ncbi:hypothetical protein GCM10007389_14550 [Pontibacter akesuensis]|nr:hypothetical protein GCM10007389_14550 [Pontibacter akesuensis]
MQSESIDTKTIFRGGGEMGDRIRQLNWANTPLGPVEKWPQSLRTAVSIMLSSKIPMMIHWGPELIHFYNDGYATIMQTKHPGALGEPAYPWWSEMWEFLTTIFDKVKAGETTYFKDQLVLPNRSGFIEEAYFTFSHSPIYNEHGEVGGIYATAIETTTDVVNQRRLAMLSHLTAHSAHAWEPAAACKSMTDSLATNPEDVPFALVYLLDETGETATLAGVTGFTAGNSESPEQLSLTDVAKDWPWPLAKVATTGKAEIITDLQERFGTLTAGAWPEPLQQAIVLPVTRVGQDATELPYALLVAGFSPRRQVDEEYKSFYTLVANHAGRAIANARAYAEERKRAEALAALDKAKTHFFHNISHEFRTPLTLMLGPLSDLAQSDLPAEAREQLALVERNGKRLLKLVNNLLNYAQAEAGRLEANYRPVEIARLTTDLSAYFRSAVEAAGLKFNVNCTPVPAPVYLDVEMWEGIVFNLLSNALKFTFEGEINVSLEQKHEQVVLTVADTGAGIPPEEIQKIFSRFHRIENTRSRTHEGSGIGLALTQELVKLHGGTIHVASTVGEGTTFTIAVPLGSSHLPAGQVTTNSAAPEADLQLQKGSGIYSGWLGEISAAESKSEAPSETEPRWAYEAAEGKKRPLVLLVDDNQDMLHYLSRILEQEYQVQTCVNGATAWDKILKESPALVISDVMMPEMDGFQLLEQIRKDERTRLLPVMLLSARAGEEARAEGMEQGADDYLVKPFNARELKARVKANLELARLRSQLTAVVTSMAEGFAVLDHRLRFTFANARALHILGKEAAAVNGKPLEEVVAANVFRALKSRIALSQKDELTRTFEYQLPEKGRWLEVRMHPLAEGTAFLLTDITFRKKAKSSLQHTLEETASRNTALMKVNETLDNFVHIAAHDLKSPINSLKALLGLYQQEQDPTLQKESFSRIEASVKKLDLTVAGLLSIVKFQSKGDRGTQEIRFADVFADLQAEFAEELQAQQGQLAADFNEAESIVYVEAYLGSIIRNVVQNALKYKSPNRPPIIHLHTERKNETVLLRVSDNGIGIDLERFGNQLFKPFKRFTNESEGNGLGLYLVKNMVERNGGHLQVESKLAIGTTLNIYLKEYPRTVSRKGNL